MSTTVAGTGARGRGIDARVAFRGDQRLRLVRSDRPREQEEGRRFLIVADASRRIARATSMAESFAALRAALVPALADRCTVHASMRRGEGAVQASACALRLSRLPEGHPLKVCGQRRESLLFSTTSSAMLRALDACNGDGAPALAGCVHVMLAPLALRRRIVVLALLRGFGRGPFDADDLLVAELALSRLHDVLRREGARFGG